LRDVDAARDVASQLRTQRWSGEDIKRYLETYGFKNSKGIVGRWPADRLAEVTDAVTS